MSNFIAKAYEALGSFEQLVKVNLQESPVIHSDETGMRAEGKTQWMHVASNNEFTYYHFDPKRGQEAIERIRSYASTLHKQNRSILDGIKQVFLQNPDFNWVAEQ